MFNKGYYFSVEQRIFLIVIHFIVFYIKKTLFKILCVLKFLKTKNTCNNIELVVSKLL